MVDGPVYKIKPMKKLIKKIIPDDVICQLRYWQKKSHYKSLRNRDQEYTLKGYDEYKCIFVHIPKTGGKSVSRAIFGNLGGGHNHIRKYKIVFGPYTFRKYYKFAFVRNPYSRLVSAYIFLSNGGDDKYDRDWANEHIVHYESFDNFVRNWINPANIFKKSHFKPQVHYICNDKLQVEVDYVGRFEELEKDFQHICGILNIERELPHYNSSNKTKRWKEYYNTETFAIVNEVYKEDFEVFNYEMI